MKSEVLQTIAQVAGLAGIAIALATLVFRDIIRKKIFPNLAKVQAYRLLRLIIVLAAILALAGIGAWVYVEKSGQDATQLTDSFVRAVSTAPPLDELECLEFCNENLRESILYADVVLSVIGTDGDNVLRSLQPQLDLLEADRRYEDCCPVVAASLYRAVGGARVLSSGFNSLESKFVEGGLPYFRRSLQLDPSQDDLRAGIEHLEGVIQAGKAPGNEIITSVYSILRYSDADIELMKEGFDRLYGGQAQHAQQWLLHEATEPMSVSDFLEIQQLRSKQEGGFDFEIEIENQDVGGGVRKIDCSLGPNTWSWLVDHERKVFMPSNYQTLQMEQFLDPAEGRGNVARFWLVHKADGGVILDVIGVVMNEFGVDHEDTTQFRTTSRIVSNDLTRVSFTLGNAMLSWDVDLDKEVYFSGDDTTELLMQSISNPPLRQYSGKSPG